MRLASLKALTKHQLVEVQMVNGVLFTGKLRVESVGRDSMDFPVEVAILSTGKAPSPAEDIFLSHDHLISVRILP